MARIKTKGYSLKKEKIKYLLLYIFTCVMIVITMLFTILYIDKIADIILLAEGIFLLFMAIFSKVFYKKYKIISAGVDGENEVKKILKMIPNQCIYTNVPIEYHYSKSEIDYLCISEKGVFIVEVKNYSGDIKGKYEDKIWKQVKRREIKEVKNPIKQLNKQIQILSSMLKDNHIDVYIDGCVYFTHASLIECKDKKIINDSKELIKRINGQKNILTKQQIKGIKKIL